MSAVVNLGSESRIELAIKVPGFYSIEELERLDQVVNRLEPQSIVVELGVQYGRSTSIILQHLVEKELKLYLVDCWCVNESDARSGFAKLLIKLVPAKAKAQVNCLWMRSSEAHLWVPGGLDLIHIDADHSPEGVDQDCALWLPKLRVGGIVLFHDWERKDAEGVPLVFPGVKMATDKYLVNDNWEDLGVVDTQKGFKRLK